MEMRHLLKTSYGIQPSTHTENLMNTHITSSLPTRQTARLTALALGLALSGATLLAPLPGYAETLQQRVAALEAKLACLTKVGTNMYIDGCNLHIRNGQNTTATTNGTGNLIVGYNKSEGSGFASDSLFRGGSHNLIIGDSHRYTSYGGLVTGDNHAIGAPGAAILGGANSVANGDYATVCGGDDNTASGDYATVSGGFRNEATNLDAAVFGGANNSASGVMATVLGGAENEASGPSGTISGGRHNTTSPSVYYATVSGGRDNDANGSYAAVSGGLNRTASGENDWVAGGLFQGQ